MPKGIYIRKPMSQTTKDKIRDRLIGNKNSLGTKMSEENRTKISKRMTGSKHLKGRKLSNKTKQKISVANKGKKRSEKCISEMRNRILGIKRKKEGEYLTDKNQLIRTSLEYDNWRKSVFERDGYRCKSCNTVGELNAHHIYNFSFHKELRFVTSNGITLCKQCHIKFHKQYGIKNNSLEQLDEFLTEKLQEQLKEAKKPDNKGK